MLERSATASPYPGRGTWATGPHCVWTSSWLRSRSRICSWSWAATSTANPTCASPSASRIGWTTTTSFRWLYVKPYSTSVANSVRFHVGAMFRFRIGLHNFFLTFADKDRVNWYCCCRIRYLYNVTFAQIFLFLFCTEYESWFFVLIFDDSHIVQ